MIKNDVECERGLGGMCELVKQANNPMEIGYKRQCFVKTYRAFQTRSFTLLTLSYTLVPAMAVSVTLFLVVFVALVSLGLVSSAKFEELFQPSWAMDHFMYEGELLKLKLDNFSGKRKNFLS